MLSNAPDSSAIWVSPRRWVSPTVYSLPSLNNIAMRVRQREAFMNVLEWASTLPKRFCNLAPADNTASEFSLPCRYARLAGVTGATAKL